MCLFGACEVIDPRVLPSDGSDDRRTSYIYRLAKLLPPLTSFTSAGSTKLAVK